MDHEVGDHWILPCGCHVEVYEDKVMGEKGKGIHSTSHCPRHLAPRLLDNGWDYWGLDPTNYGPRLADLIQDLEQEPT